MSTLEIHGGRIGDRPAGGPISGRMQPTDEQLARQVRRDVQQLASRTRLTGDALDKQAVALVKTRYRGAVALLCEEAIMALTRKLGLDECSWCKVRELCKDKNKLLPQPAPALRVALGSMCSPCKVAWNAVESAAYEKTLAASLTAAGIRPELSGVLRSAEEVARYQRGTAPTGAIAAAGRGQSRAASARLPVRDAIRLARARQQQRETTYVAASEPGLWYGSKRIGG